MTQDPSGIRNFQRLDESTTTSGRLRAEDVADLAAIGVRHVIDLSLPSHPEALADADAVCGAHGIARTAIPVPFDAPEDAHFDAFCMALSAHKGPVHVHCIMNWRVSAFFYRLNRDHRGMAEADARALMERQWRPDTDPDHRDGPWAAFIAPR